MPHGAAFLLASLPLPPPQPMPRTVGGSHAPALARGVGFGHLPASPMTPPPLAPTSRGGGGGVVSHCAISGEGQHFSGPAHLWGGLIHSNSRESCPFGTGLQFRAVSRISRGDPTSRGGGVVQPAAFFSARDPPTSANFGSCPATLRQEAGGTVFCFAFGGAIMDRKWAVRVEFGVKPIGS